MTGSQRQQTSVSRPVSGLRVSLIASGQAQEIKTFWPQGLETAHPSTQHPGTGISLMGHENDS